MFSTAQQAIACALLGGLIVLGLILGVAQRRRRREAELVSEVLAEIRAGVMQTPGLEKEAGSATAGDPEAEDALES